VFTLQQYPPRPVSSRRPPEVAQWCPAVYRDRNAVYNQVRWIGRTIESVLEQRYPQLRYAVQDAASRDGTAEIIERYRGDLAAYESAPTAARRRR